MSAKNDNYLKTLAQLFDNPEVSSQDKVLNLMDETVNFIKDIKGKLESGDPEVQKEAFAETIEMKKLLESKMQGLADKTGLDIAQLASLAQNSNAMTAEQKSAIESRLKNFQEKPDKDEKKPFLINKI